MSRPKGSRLGAWVSEQSSAIQEDTLQTRMKSLEAEYADKEVQCPEHWGGWRIVPL
jgi:pyridoxamine 5'-phosphate oxidase